MFTGGINRYIVGCKFKQVDTHLKEYYELIDTQWDVNCDGLNACARIAMN